MAIISNPLSYDQIRKISEAIERKLRRTKTFHVILIGICLLTVSLTAFLFSRNFIGNEPISGYDLAFKFKLKAAFGFALLHVLTLFALLLPGLHDKFRYATLFVLISIPLLFILYFYEAPRIIPGFPKPESSANGSIVSFLMLLQCWILFGLESYKSRSKNPVFIFLGFLNDKIQYFFDEYAMLDYRKAIKKFKTRHKKQF